MLGPIPHGNVQFVVVVVLFFQSTDVMNIHQRGALNAAKQMGVFFFYTLQGPFRQLLFTTHVNFNVFRVGLRSDNIAQIKHAFLSLVLCVNMGALPLNTLPRFPSLCFLKGHEQPFFLDGLE